MFQTYFIESDPELMVRKKKKLFQAKVYNREKHEDVGMIEYLFIDKTGIITESEVELRVLMIGDQIHGYL